MADVLIVGYGPVGQTTAVLLAQRGWTVTVVERWPEPFTMPRAVSFDGESARALAAAGVGEHIERFGEPSGDYVWRNADGETLLHVDVAEHGQCGWPDSTSMYQPGLEAALAERGSRLPGLRVLRGHRAVELTDDGDRVTLVADSRDEGRVHLTGRWVIGCDGANSFVRERMGVTLTDLGFANDWLTCDVALHEPRRFVPNNLQICDPARPSTAVSAGPGHRRWEFMRVPGEPIEELDRVETVWRLLAPFDVTPKNATLQRQAVYRFQARYADEWRVGRILLAGDSAHLMPPFAGQGMCSGFRDAVNLAWKLDLVLAGKADESLLDTYTAERRSHVQHAIGMSVNLGKVICQPDPKAAADRDMVMLATRKRNEGRPQQDSAVYHPLTTGLLGGGSTIAGSLVPQGRVSRGGRTGLLDEVIGNGFVLLAREDPQRLLGADALAALAEIDTQLVHLVPAADRAVGDRAVVDVDGVHLSYLDHVEAVGVLVRPDFYAFGGARDGTGLGELVADLRGRLSSAALAG
ncbi:MULTISPECIES: bifunctional 3-(3-hydroxy-phenyl)propionate/3-hydroxycinnamic acid hydroxylase [unclassified Streptomyces]|uniref:bifunctional 3-(3-hydroxy-phenyl)propionate/3-hydroxycinnamic acid hydroxylase MhpA n=1 Tax=unclassified Streptomyces TaxID=2593676 RepID=UPI0033F52D11